jgi:hypothetical protein
VSAANLKDGDLLFMIVAPSQADCATFWDGYEYSPAERADMESRDLVVCSDSNLFDAVKVE